MGSDPGLGGFRRCHVIRYGSDSVADGGGSVDSLLRGAKRRRIGGGIALASGAGRAEDLRRSRFGGLDWSVMRRGDGVSVDGALAAGFPAVACGKRRRPERVDFDSFDGVSSPVVGGGSAAGLPLFRRHPFIQPVCPVLHLNLFIPAPVAIQYAVLEKST